MSARRSAAPAPRRGGPPPDRPVGTAHPRGLLAGSRAWGWLGPNRRDDHAAVLKLWSKCYRDLGGAVLRWSAGCTRCYASWSPAASSRRSPQAMPRESSDRSGWRTRLRPPAASSLLTNEDRRPVAVRVFAGEHRDPKTRPGGIRIKSAQSLKRSLRPWSMNAVSTGLAPPPAKWPHTPGMTRSSALGMRSTSQALSSGGK